MVVLAASEMVSPIVAVSTFVSLVVPVDVIGIVDVDVASVEPQVAALVMVTACVVMSVLVLKLAAVVDVTTVSIVS